MGFMFFYDFGLFRCRVWGVRVLHFGVQRLEPAQESESFAASVP